jgi:hypothetical protein
MKKQSLAASPVSTSAGQVVMHVEVPQWVRFGMGSYAETPKGAYCNGVGAPSWKHLVRWKVFEDTGELEIQPEKALRKVVTDKYFRELKDSVADSRNGPEVSIRALGPASR